MNKVVCLLALVAVSCSNESTPGGFADASVDAARAADTGVARTDTNVRTDTRTDMCLATRATSESTVGCNGYAPAQTPNSVWGPCTPGDENDPAGSCTHPDAECVEFEDVPLAYCVVACDDTASYVSLGGCPTGNRCFDGRADDEPGVCYQDCDATHRCPSGMACDGEGSCVFEEGPPPADAGRPDATTPTQDGSVVTTDSSAPAADAGPPPADTGTSTSDAATPADDVVTPAVDATSTADSASPNG